MTQLVESLDVTKAQLKTKASLNEMKELKQVTSLLPTNDDLQALKDMIYGAIEKYHAQADEYMIKYENCC